MYDVYFIISGISNK